MGVRAATTREAGMRWTRRRQQTTGPGTDGQVVWSGRPDAGALRNAFTRCRNIGGKNAGPHGEREAAVTPSRREGRVNSAEPVVPAPCILVRTGAAGASRHSVFPAPLCDRGQPACTARARMRRGEVAYF